MKFIFYKNGRKYTINNATLYDASDYFPDMYVITSTRGSVSDDDEIVDNQELMEEVREGIAWYDESIN